MAAVAGQMNHNNTAAASMAAALATGQMILRLSTADGTMQDSEPAATTGLQVTQSHATDGLMILNINS
jgi:hypothetical protein